MHVFFPAFTACAPKGCNYRALGAKKVSVTRAKDGLGLVTDTARCLTPPAVYGFARTTPALSTRAISWVSARSCTAADPVAVPMKRVKA